MGEIRRRKSEREMLRDLLCFMDDLFDNLNECQKYQFDRIEKG